MEAVEKFMRICNVVKGFKGARIGIIDPRPERFETCSFNERNLIAKFDQTFVPINQAIVFKMARELKDDDPEVLRIMNDIKDEAKRIQIKGGKSLKNS